LRSSGSTCRFKDFEDLKDFKDFKDFRGTPAEYPIEYLTRCPRSP
jgi:hypothetical protein